MFMSKFENTTEFLRAALTVAKTKRGLELMKLAMFSPDIQEAFDARYSVERFNPEFDLYQQVSDFDYLEVKLKQIWNQWTPNNILEIANLCCLPQIKQKKILLNVTNLRDVTEKDLEDALNKIRTIDTKVNTSNGKDPKRVETTSKYERTLPYVNFNQVTTVSRENWTNFTPITKRAKQSFGWPHHTNPYLYKEDYTISGRFWTPEAFKWIKDESRCYTCGQLHHVNKTPCQFDGLMFKYYNKRMWNQIQLLLIIRR
ncbi:hypothetical protein TBLA_0A08175 [Henningerozyma blattae CBS 6284]|uniref:Uncharacterized protein n=1 Tax=Henningerozyma blattae (strain ATCC 34711 / CBS 6284 / DSM 70876 / NBRC 10599 / NRRL Y-10934 / UCD 77-7) TaxID=1071380 RepID=I2GWV5_HENB6|nr:hypothetical protein TBLA_0A08175 [Tetrapisispora blattae CBS 6284]CCH58607.1 hypothetical protein TBLA_0A08175 [Tetrapisispora blattae CBS 6284]